MFSFWATKSKAERWLEGQLSDIHSRSDRKALLSVAGELDKRLTAASKSGVEPFPLVLVVAGNPGLQQEDVVQLLRQLLVHLEVLADGGKHLLERPTASVFSADRLPFAGQHHDGCSCRLWGTPDCKVQVLCDQACTAYRTADNVVRLQLENYTVDQLAELFENKAKALGWTSAGWRTAATSGDLKSLLSNVAEEHRNALNGNLVDWVVCCLRNTVDPKQLTFYWNDFDAALFRYKMDRPDRMKSIARSLLGISHLSLPACGIDDSMTKELASGLRDNTCLRSLELVANRITSQGLRTIGEHVSPALVHLDVSHNPLGDTGAAELAALLPRNPTLVSVGFSSVKLTDKGIGAVLAAVFERCPNILKLTLHEDGHEAACRAAQRILHTKGYQWMFRDGSTKTTKRLRLQLPLLCFLHACPAIAAAGLPQSVITSILNAKLDEHDLFLCGSESEDTTTATTMSLPGLTSFLEESGIGQGLTTLSLRRFDYSNQPGLWAALPSASWVANLDTLALHGHRLTSAMLALQAPFWRGMCNLRSLSLSNNRLTKLDGLWWAPLQKLERLDLSFNSILDVDPQSFGSLLSLTSINLTENRITVPRGTNDFPQLPRLTILDLDANPCNSGEPQTDEELVYNSVNSPERPLVSYGPGLGQSDHSAVTRVDLSWNRFDEIPQALTWKIFSNLDELDLSHNHITALPREPKGLPFCAIKLTHLDLRHNALTVLTTNFFSQMPQLKRLHLDYNRIAAIKEGTFTGLGSLEALTISNNKLGHEFALNLHALLAPLSALRVLDLSRNPLMRTVGAMFGNSAGSLEVIQMSQASIYELHATTFQGCTQLKRLDLHDNGIRSLSEKLFCSLEGLETLDISYNLLAELPWDSLPDLKDLDASWNRLETKAISPSVPILQRLLCKARVCLEGNYLDLQSDIWRHIDQGRVELQVQLPVESDGREESQLIDLPVLIVGERVVPLSRKKWQDVAHQSDYVELMAKGKRIALPHIAAQAFETVVLPANAILEGEKLTSLWVGKKVPPSLEALAMRKAAIITRGDTFADVFKGPEISRRTCLETLKQKMRELADADEKNVKLHMLHVVLKGNTGVGKTTVAQAIADVYFRLGLVKKRGVVEVNREHLVGKALGETEERTEAQIKEALGGVMFVDEAYALNGDLYGRQAITLLMNHLNRDQVVFIFAGYEGDMNEFLKVNPGFRQRIAFEFILPDYTPLQLAEILKVKIEHEELKLPEDVLGKGLVEMISRNFPDYIIRGANGAIARIILEGLKIMRRPDGNHSLSIGDIEAAIARARGQLSHNSK